MATRAGLILQSVNEGRYRGYDDDASLGLSDLEDALEILADYEVEVNDSICSVAIMADKKNVELSIYSDPPLPGSNSDQMIVLAKGTMEIYDGGNEGTFSFTFAREANSDATMKALTTDLLVEFNNEYSYARGADYGQGDENDERAFNQKDLTNSLREAMEELGSTLKTILKKHLK